MRFHLSFQNHFNPRFFLQRLLLVLVGFWTAAPMRAQVNSYTETVNGVSFTMVRVKGGTFTMGCTEEQAGECYEDESPAHRVTLSDYSIGETEVTQALWYAVVEFNPSESNPDCNLCPVENVSWKQVQDFIHELNSMTGRHYRLPTEAEWEFAARGGTNGQGYKYSGSHVVYKVAWSGENAEGITHPVKGKKPNELGLYDMSGNVSEWCQDLSSFYSQSYPNGPIAINRICRGGNWNRLSRGCRVSYRGYAAPDDRAGTIGFRLASQ